MIEVGFLFKIVSLNPAVFSYIEAVCSHAERLGLFFEETGSLAKQFAFCITGLINTELRDWQ